MVDGEGCVSVSYRTPRDQLHGIHGSFGAYVAVVNTWKPIVLKCSSAAGCGSITNRPGTNLPSYCWAVLHRNAARVLVEIYPYLIQKREQAKVALLIQSMNRPRGFDGKGNSIAISESEFRERIRLWKLCKDLNARRVTSSGLPEPSLSLPNDTKNLARSRLRKPSDYSVR